MLAVQTKDLSKTYLTEHGEQLKVLDRINIEIPSGAFVSLVGASGGGKSTLLEILAGLKQPSSGQVIIHGKEEYQPTAQKGVVFQKDAVFPWLTVKQNITYGLNLKKEMSQKEREERAASFLDMVGLTPYASYFPKELSGGMRKRLAIATVFANDPQILFMDEPFGSLDYTSKVALHEELLTMWQMSNKTIVFVTHDLEEALFLSSQIHVLKKGLVAASVDVPFPRPRDFELRNDPAFRKELSELWQYMR